MSDWDQEEAILKKGESATERPPAYDLDNFRTKP